MTTQSTVLTSFVVLAIFWVVKKILSPNPLDKVPGPAPSSWLNGSFKEAFNIMSHDFHIKLAKEYGPTSVFRTVYGGRHIYTFDPKAMHQILVKEQMVSFDASRVNLESFGLLFGRGLLGSDGELHRKQKKLLTPVFSIAHMRNILPIFYEVVHKLEYALSKKLETGPQEIDILSWMSRAALEIVGQAGFGHSFDDLKDGTKPNPYVGSMKGLVPLLGRTQFSRTYILPYIAQFGNDTLRRVGATLLSYVWKDFRDGKRMSDYMWEVSKGVLGKKKVSGSSERLGKDIMSVLLEANDKAADEDRLEEDLLLAQLSTLTFAAMDTSSTALSHILWILAENPEAQRRLREELQSAFEHGDLPYDQLDALPFMDAVIRETLRLHPPAHRILRTTLKDTILALSTPVTCKDGSVTNELVVPRGTDIMISIFNSNRNKALWGEDADEWKPERWLKPVPNAVTEAKIPGVYSHLMTFNAGARSCIGLKFAELEIKVVLSTLIRNFKFQKSDKKILWLAAPIGAPIVVTSPSTGPQLPMVLERVH